jgi:photosystem II stability/assembly factor-like uncharacterized protein
MRPETKTPGILTILSAFLLLSFAACNKPDSNINTEPVEWHVICSLENVYMSALSFPDADTGFAVGSEVDNGGYFLHGLIYKTTDGGDSWSAYTDISIPDLFTVFFTDSYTGYAGGTGCILKTTDGGDHWATIFNDRTSNIQSVYFPDESTGYAVGLFGLILKTTDAGQTWANQVSGTNCLLQSVDFLDNQTGYSTGYWNQDNDLHGIILKTVDGGTTWDSIPYPGQELPNAITFTTSDIGYVLGSNTVLKTTNAGNSWEINYSYPNRNLTSLSFIRNSPSGLAVGQDGTILKTTDAGISWTDFSDDKFASLLCVVYVNYNLAFALGFDSQTREATILKWP